MLSEINESKLEKVLLDMYHTFAIDNDDDKLLEKLMKTLVDYVNCDAGTLYLMKKNEHGQDCLDFKIILTKSKGVFMNFTEDTPKPESLLPVAMRREFVAAHCALEKRIVNIPDVYQCHDKELNFTGVKTYDSYNDYKTTSMLNFPIQNDFDEVIAVVQLINCMEGGNVIPFSMHYNDVLESFAAQVGVILRSVEFSKSNTELFYSFVEVLSDSIDDMSPFNTNHSNNMVKLVNNFLNWLKKNNKPLQFTANEREQMIMTVQLQDIGKITTPSELTNKVKRLDTEFELLLGRIEKMKIAYELAYYQGKLDQDVSDEKMAELDDILDLLFRINTKNVLTDEEYSKLKSLKTARFRSVNGREEALFTIEEYESLSVKRGMHSVDQREKLEEHVQITEKLLSQIKFTNTFKDVTFWASAHHELLNGRGYPKGLQGEQIPKPVRLITILDRYEVLTKEQHPQKQKINLSPEQSIHILRDCVKSGELDGEIVELFAESLGLA